jgi:MoaA/NifB/PqqE/SkfB family radical SAM enzyme
MCSTLTNPNRDGSALRAAIEGLNHFLPTVQRIKMMGDGEVFAVPESRDFMFNFDAEKNPDTDFLIHTNGILLTPKLWNKIEHCKIDWMVVSMDGATKETYEKIRVGGKWETLIENLHFLKEKFDQGLINEFHINMCVMRSNYHEMLDFARLGKELGVTSAYYLPILGDYESEQIFEPPDAAILSEIQEMLQDPLMQDPAISTDALTPWKNWQPPQKSSILRRAVRKASS